MLDKPKKGGGLLLALMGKSKPKPAFGEDEESEADSGPDSGVDLDGDDGMGDEHSMAFDSFADAVGIPAEKRAGAQDALEQFVRACARGGDDDTEE